METDCTAAVGPLVSVPRMGDCPSESGTFPSLPSGKAPVSRPNGVLEETISSYYAALKGCKISPRIIMPEEKIVRSLNRSALSRIFANLISNAMKYSDGDLTVSLSKEGEILFSNHASGLNELQAMQLLNRYYTVESAGQSTGLGLSIARELTEKMNGKIAVRFLDGILSISILFP